MRRRIEAKRAITGAPQAEGPGLTTDSGACIRPSEGSTMKHTYYGTAANDLSTGRLSLRGGKREEEPEPTVQTRQRSTRQAGMRTRKTGFSPAGILLPSPELARTGGRAVWWGRMS